MELLRKEVTAFFESPTFLSLIGFKSEPKSVCAAVIEGNEVTALDLQTFANCITCQKKNFVCLCFTCFTAGDHSGHKFFFKKFPVGAMCDCGDPAFFKPSGHCQSHSGTSSLAKDIPPAVAEAFRNQLMRLLTQMVYFFSFNLSVCISEDFLCKVVETWNYLWSQLARHAQFHLNILLLTVETLADKPLFRRHLLGPKLDDLLAPIHKLLEGFSTEIRVNLERVFPGEAPGGSLSLALQLPNFKRNTFSWESSASSQLCTRTPQCWT